MMESSITPDRIANSILQDKSHDGYYLLVEGKKDIPLYRKLINKKLVKLRPTFGKYKMRSAVELLNQRGFDKKFGIRDADFIRIREDYCPNYNEKIFITDCHDAEGMMINQDCFFDFLYTISTEKNITDFNEKYGDVRELIYTLAYPIGCLRLANKIYQLGLSFKPESPQGNKFKIRNIISEKDFTFQGNLTLIKTIVNYSTNRDDAIADQEIILEKLEEVISEKYSHLEIANGHDLSEILHLVCRKGLKSKDKTLGNADCVESMLTMSFNYTNFMKTNLFGLLDQYQLSQNDKILAV
jgi:hypothetical protein